MLDNFMIVEDKCNSIYLYFLSSCMTFSHLFFPCISGLDSSSANLFDFSQKPTKYFQHIHRERPRINRPKEFKPCYSSVKSYRIDLLIKAISDVTSSIANMCIKIRYHNIDGSSTEITVLSNRHTVV